jgi:hypothetical protein
MEKISRFDYIRKKYSTGRKKDERMEEEVK